MNNSTVLANRTRRFIADIKPDVVFVQTNEKWWNGAKMLNYIKSEEEMNKAKPELAKAFEYKLIPGIKTSLYELRFNIFNFLFKNIYGLPLEYNPVSPGLEVKYALEEAEKAGSKIVYLGYEINEKTTDRLYHENRYTILKTFVNFFRLNKKYHSEIDSFNAKVHHYGIKKFVEACCDTYTINWLVQSFGLLFPDVRRIFIEKKEEDIFKSILENKGKKTVVLVNQFHMEGIEHHWCHSFGQAPKSQQHDINPIGDMSLRQTLYENMYHVIMRDVKSSRTKSPPSSFSNFPDPYWRENNYQYEHRNM
jgi:hypothetical protein